MKLGPQFPRDDHAHEDLVPFVEQVLDDFDRIVPAVEVGQIHEHVALARDGHRSIHDAALAGGGLPVRLFVLTDALASVTKPGIYAVFDGHDDALSDASSG